MFLADGFRNEIILISVHSFELERQTEFLYWIVIISGQIRGTDSGSYQTVAVIF